MPRENRLEVLAFADELTATPALVHAWSQTFGPKDAVTLIIHPGRIPPNEIEDHLLRAIDAAGIAADTALDLQALAGPLSDVQEAELAVRCAYALTEAGLREPFGMLTPVARRELPALRRQLPGSVSTDSISSAAFRCINIYGGMFRYRNTESDLHVVRSIFLEEAYSLERLGHFWPGMRRYKAAGPASDKRPLIIDGGANIGASSIYCAVKYPGATVIAVEPHHENFKLLDENTRRFGNIITLNNALSSHHGLAPVSDPGEGTASIRVGRRIARGRIVSQVETLTISEIVSAHPHAVPFLLKLDVEGSEADIFSGNTSVISRFPVVVVELHERLFPGRKTGHPFLRWHMAADRDLHQTGESTWSILSSLAI